MSVGAQLRDKFCITKINKYFSLDVKSANPIFLPSHPAAPLAAFVNRSGSVTKTQMCVSPVFQQRQETNKSIPRTSSTPLSASPSVLFTEFTHHFHLSKQSFKFLKVERRATVGGAATGSLSKPEHCVKYLRDINVEVLVNIHTC